jgi:hypothetical protein
MPLLRHNALFLLLVLLLGTSLECASALREGKPNNDHEERKLVLLPQQKYAMKRERPQRSAPSAGPTGEKRRALSREKFLVLLKR